MGGGGGNFFPGLRPNPTYTTEVHTGINLYLDIFVRYAHGGY
jgi:hypothetical protein